MTDPFGRRSTRPVRAPVPVRKALSEFYTVYDDVRDAVWTEASATRPATVAAKATAGRDLERLAMFNDEWRPYLDHLRAVGAAYADADISYQAAYEAESAWAWYVVPHLVDAYRDRPDRLTAALRGQQKFLEMTAPFVAAGYHDQLTLRLNRLAGVVASTDDPVYSLDTDGHVQTWNRGAQSVYGYSAAEIIGTSASHLSPPDRSDDASTLFDRVEAANDVVRMDAVHVTSEGKKFPVSLTASPIRSDEQLVGVAVIARDVTAQRRAQAELKQLNDDLDQFVDIVSHDLRAPLSSIASLVGWFEEDLPPEAMTPDIKENLDLLRARIARMGTLLTDLLNYTRLSRSDWGVDRVDTHAVVTEVADLLPMPAAFQVQIDGRLPKILAPRAPLEHVFLNLISNAVHHHDREDGRIEVSAQRRRLDLYGP